MDNEKKNRILIICVVVILLILVLAFIIYSLINSKSNENTSLVKATINQIYSSDYNLISIDDTYFIGSYIDKEIDVIIDSTGKEILTTTDEFKYDGIYRMKNGKYLIYSNIDDRFITYVFDGNELKKFYEIKDVSYIKPIIYKSLDNEYVIGFASIVEDDLYLYNLDSSGILVVNNVSLVADYNDNGIYYTYNDNYLVVKNNLGMMGVIDINGETIIDYKYLNIINTYDNAFIVVNKKGKYGIINKNDEVLVKCQYKVIDSFKDYYLFVNTNNKMALYDREYNRLTDYEMNYDTLIDYDLRSEYNSINLYKVDGKVVVVNNYLEDKNGTQYDKHNLYIISDGKVQKTINQIGFGNDSVLYTYNENYEVSIYDSQFILMFEVALENVKRIIDIYYVSSDVICIRYYNIYDELVETYYNKNGIEVDFILGDLVTKTLDYYGYLKKENKKYKLTLYDIEGNYLDNIIGSNIEIVNNYLIVDNSIYKIEISNT